MLRNFKKKKQFLKFLDFEQETKWIPGTKIKNKRNILLNQKPEQVFANFFLQKGFVCFNPTKKLTLYTNKWPCLFYTAPIYKTTVRVLFFVATRSQAECPKISKKHWQVGCRSDIVVCSHLFWRYSVHVVCSCEIFCFVCSV